MVVVAIDTARVRNLLSAGDSARTRKAKGDALEAAVKYVFSLVPNLVFYDSTLRDHQGVREIDLLFTNRLGLPFLPWLLPIECKNHAQPAGYRDIVDFKDLVKSKNLSAGILASSNGFAGQPGRGAASAIEDALQQGVTILVITRNDLETVNNTDDWSLLLEERYTYLTAFGTHPPVSQ